MAMAGRRSWRISDWRLCLDVRLSGSGTTPTTALLISLCAKDSLCFYAISHDPLRHQQTVKMARRCHFPRISKPEAPRGDGVGHPFVLPFPLPRRERVRVRVCRVPTQGFGYALQHALQVPQDVAVPEPHHPVALPVQLSAGESSTIWYVLRPSWQSLPRHAVHRPLPRPVSSQTSECR